jgi:hypothetical protein
LELLNRFKTFEKLIVISLVIIPFLKGLFFKEVYLPVLVFYTVLLIFLTIKSKVFILDRKFLILFTLQIVIGICSMLYGINREEAIYGFFLLMFPIVIYFFFLNITYDYCDMIYKTLTILFFSGAIISIINYLMELIFNNTNNLIGFAWVIPYSNTLALYMFISSIAGLFLVEKQRFEIKKKVLIISGICLNISGLVFTYSRTMLVIAVVFYVIYFLIQKNKRVKLDFTVIYVLSALSVTLYSIYKWKSFLLTFILCMLLAYIYEKSSDKLADKLKNFKFIIKQNGKLLFAMITIVIFVILTIILIFKSTDIFNKIQAIIGSDQTLRERFAYYGDSISIIKDFPILGIGPGGWESILYKYQTAMYFSKYVHSSIIQVALNYGLAGLTVFLLQITIFISYFIKALRNKASIKFRGEILCIFIINAAILLHSILDIDFEFQIINLIFWINIAFLTLLSGEKLVKITTGKIEKSILGTILISLIMMSSLMYASNAFYLNGMKNIEIESYQEAVRSFDKAIILNPFSSGSFYQKGYALGEIFINNSEEKVLKEATEAINNAKKYNSSNPIYSNRIGFIFYMTQDYDESVKQYEELLVLQPLVLSNYEGYSTSLLRKAENLYYSGKVKQAGNEFKKIIEIEKQLKSINDKLSPNAFKLKHKPELTLSPKLSYNVNEAYFYLEKY